MSLCQSQSLVELGSLWQASGRVSRGDLGHQGLPKPLQSRVFDRKQRRGDLHTWSDERLGMSFKSSAPCFSVRVRRCSRFWWVVFWTDCSMYTEKLPGLRTSRDSTSVKLRGPGGMLSAVWWAGVLSKIQPGYPPSQQCAEQLNTKVKRDMETLPRETHAQVCQSLEKVIGTWSATLKKGEEMLDTPKLALTAPSRQIGMDRPPEPDDWMIHGKSHVVLKPGAIQKRFPSIPVILQQMRTLNSAGTSPFFESVQLADGRSIICMAQNRPEHLALGRLRHLRKYLNTTDSQTLCDMFVEDGILERTDVEAAPYRFKLKAYCDIFDKYCLCFR